jgi:hypothetical protein
MTSTPHTPVGASLLAKAIAASRTSWRLEMLREQARSYESSGATGLAVTPPHTPVGASLLAKAIAASRTSWRLETLREQARSYESSGVSPDLMRNTP